jgi:hypothetical protein
MKCLWYCLHDLPYVEQPLSGLLDLRVLQVSHVGNLGDGEMSALPDGATYTVGDVS